MIPNNPYARASQFFGGAFNAMEQASEQQARTQGVGMDDARYGADYTPNYMQGAVPPEMGPYGGNPSQDTEGMERLKSELLETARGKSRPSNGEAVMRAGGGTNPAIRS
jgi:hypothetical protein